MASNVHFIGVTILALTIPIAANAGMGKYEEPLTNHPKYIEANAQLEAKD